MTFPERMLYGGGLQAVAVPLRLAHSPPVITCFQSFLGTHGSERATAVVEASRTQPRVRGMAAQAEAAPRAGAAHLEPVAVVPGSGRQRGGGRATGEGTRDALGRATHCCKPFRRAAAAR